MTTLEIANRLVALCREGKDAQAQEELYAPHVKSIESAGENPVVEGLENLAHKAVHFANTFEVIKNHVADPLVAGDFFSTTMKIEVIHKASQQAMTLEELCVYGVKEGKVVLEQFFYTEEDGSM